MNTLLEVSKVKLSPLAEGDRKAPFSLATTPRCTGGRYSWPWIAPLYPSSVPLWWWVLSKEASSTIFLSLWYNSTIDEHSTQEAMFTKDYY